LFQGYIARQSDRFTRVATLPCEELTCSVGYKNLLKTELKGVNGMHDVHVLKAANAMQFCAKPVY